MHLQIIVSRKDITNRIKLSPLNNSRGTNVSHSAKLGQFDRRAFKESGEMVFDRMFDFRRNLKDTMLYASTMRNGTIQDKTALYRLANFSTTTDNASLDDGIRRADGFFSNTPSRLLDAITEILEIVTHVPVGGASQSDMAEEERRKRKLRRKS